MRLVCLPLMLLSNLLLAAVLLPAPALAETSEVSASRRVLGLKEAVLLGLAQNPDLLRVGLGVTQAGSAISTARSLFDPLLGLNGSWSDAESRGYFQGFAFDSLTRSWDAGASLSGSLPTGTSYSLGASSGWQYSRSELDLLGLGGGEPQIQEYNKGSLNIGLRQELLEGLSPSYNLRTLRGAREALDQARTEERRAREELCRQVAGLYFTWTLAEQAVGIRASSLESARSTEESVLARAREGKASEIDTGQAGIARLQAESDLLGARRDARSTADSLLVLLGEAPGQAITPGDARELLLERDDLATWSSWVQASNPELEVARAQVESARRSLGDALHARLPSLALEGSASLGNQDSELGEAISGLAGDEAWPAWGLGLDFTVPLGNRAARAQHEQSRAELKSKELALEGIQRSLDARVRAALDDVHTAREAFALATARLELARRTAAVEALRYQEGTRTLDRLLVARDAESSAALAVEQGRASLANAILSLNLLAGRAGALLDGLPAAANP